MPSHQSELGQWRGCAAPGIAVPPRHSVWHQPELHRSPELARGLAWGGGSAARVDLSSEQGCRFGRDGDHPIDVSREASASASVLEWMGRPTRGCFPAFLWIQLIWQPAGRRLGPERFCLGVPRRSAPVDPVPPVVLLSRCRRGPFAQGRLPRDQLRRGGCPGISCAGAVAPGSVATDKSRRSSTARSAVATGRFETCAAVESPVRCWKRTTPQPTPRSTSEPSRLSRRPSNAALITHCFT